jgi:hypothetical protein
MTIENGAQEAANDTALPEDQAPELVDVVYDGKSYQLPPELKDALLRQADYTRKTQEVAQARKAVEAACAEHHQSAAHTRAHIQDAARIVALNDQLAQFGQVDWQALQARDPAGAQNLYRQFEQIKSLRDRAARAWLQKEQDHASHAKRATARRVDEVHAHLPRLIADWSPELDERLRVYGTEQGLSHDEMVQAALHNPIFLKLLHKAHQFDEAAKTRQVKQTFEAAQGARPVTRVGGTGGTAGRRTTDASGDALSTEEWVKRDRERMRKR